MHHAALAFALIAALASSPVSTAATGQARAPRLYALPGPVRALGAGRAGVVVASGADVLWIDALGLVRKRYGSGERPSVRRHAGLGLGSGRDGFAIGAGLLSDGDFNDPYDTDSDVEDAENLFLDRDGVVRRDRSRSAVELPVVVAAGGARLWMARSDGLWRIDGENEAAERVLSAAAARFTALAASGDGRWLVAERRGWLLRSSDGGATFDAFAPVSGRARSLAVTNGGAALFIDRLGARVARAGADGAEPTGAPGSIDVVACGGEALELVAGRMVTLAFDDAGRVSVRDGVEVPEGAERLACAADGSAVAAFGASLWTSADRGQTWSRRADLPPTPIEAVAIGADAVWAATASGLWSLPLIAPEPTRAVNEPESATQPGSIEPLAQAVLAAAAAARGSASAPWQQSPWWTAVLPIVDIGFVEARASNRSDVRAFILLTFALDRSRAHTAERHRLAAESAIRHQTAAVTSLSLSLSQLAITPHDPVGAEERAALARALEIPP